MGPLLSTLVHARSSKWYWIHMHQVERQGRERNLSNETIMTTPAVPIPSVRTLPIAVAQSEQLFPHGDDAKQKDAAIVVLEAT